MNKFFIVFILISITSCDIKMPNDANFQKDIQEINSLRQKKIKKNDPIEENIIITSDIKACMEGCDWTFNILTGLKRADKNTLKLNVNQILSLNKSCVNFCQKEMIILKEEVDSFEKAPSFKTFEEKVEKKKIKPKKQNQETEFKPFEDL